MRDFHSTERAWPGIASALLVLLALPAGFIEAAAPAWFNSTDYTKLQQRLGSAMPTGAGGTVSLVEAGGGGSYFADVSSSEFNASLDPVGAPVVLTDGSNASRNGFSNHATWSVGQYFFGNTQSAAPGANSVVNYDAASWLSSILHIVGNAPPESQPFRVQNHSWIGTGNGNQELAALRRYDYLIETGELTAVVGANNAANFTSLTAHPTLFAHSYNAIVVGRSDGGHSRGQTNNTIGAGPYGAGRYRPDIVAPFNATSTATAMVSSTATMLHESGAGTDAVRSEVMKAILMAGATKNEFANWLDQTSGVVNPWNHTQTRPLDDVFGAGELNVYNSYAIQLGGKQSASTSAPAAAVKSYGWDYQNRKTDSAVGDLYYNFEVPFGSTASELSIMLAWNAKVTDLDPSVNVFTPSESLQNLNLQFYNSTNSFMGTLVDQSISTVDNVEHIYLTNLNPGTYTLKVTGAANWDYGLAWRMSTAFNSPNADFNGDGVVDGADFMVWQRNSSRLVNAANGDGDADGDGDVDADDLAILNSMYGTSIAPPMLASVVATVPEPASVALALAGIAALGMLNRQAIIRRK